MGFELNIAVKRDPLEMPQSMAPTASRTSSTTITLNGSLENDALQAVVRALADLCEQGAESIVVDMQNIDADDAACLREFAESIMALRGAGSQVQVAAADPGLHAKMSKLADSRDWLLALSVGSPSGLRRSIHVDRHENE